MPLGHPVGPYRATAAVLNGVSVIFLPVGVIGLSMMSYSFEQELSANQGKRLAVPTNLRLSSRANAAFRLQI